MQPDALGSDARSIAGPSTAALPGASDWRGTELARGFELAMRDEGSSSADARREEREPLRPQGRATVKYKGCQACHAVSVSCTDGERPCARCIRLGIVCDETAEPRKVACTYCKSKRVKCDLDLQHPCSRCARLGLTVCEPHVPTWMGPKRKRALGL